MTLVETQFVTVPPPAPTRLAAYPSPEKGDQMPTTASPRTTAVEIITEEEEEEEEYDTPVTVVRPRPTRRPPAGWFGGW
jgi:hypothetical protein